MLEGELMIRCLQACRVVANRHRLAGVLLVLIFLSTLPLGGETSAEEIGAIDWLRDDSSARQQAIEAKKYLLKISLPCPVLGRVERVINLKAPAKACSPIGMPSRR